MRAPLTRPLARPHRRGRALVSRGKAPALVVRATTEEAAKTSSAAAPAAVSSMRGLHSPQQGVPPAPNTRTPHPHTHSMQSPAPAAAPVEYMPDGEFSVSKISFGSILTPVGVGLLVYGFGAYFTLLPGADVSSIMLIYGFPMSVLGFALR